MICDYKDAQKYFKERLTLYENIKNESNLLLFILSYLYLIIIPVMFISRTVC